MTKEQEIKDLKKKVKEKDQKILYLMDKVDSLERQLSRQPHPCNMYGGTSPGGRD